MRGKHVSDCGLPHSRRVFTPILRTHAHAHTRTRAHTHTYVETVSHAGVCILSVALLPCYVVWMVAHPFLTSVGIGKTSLPACSATLSFACRCCQVKKGTHTHRDPRSLSLSLARSPSLTHTHARACALFLSLSVSLSLTHTHTTHTHTRAQFSAGHTTAGTCIWGAVTSSLLPGWFRPLHSCSCGSCGYRSV